MRKISSYTQPRLTLYCNILPSCPPSLPRFNSISSARSRGRTAQGPPMPSPAAERSVRNAIGALQLKVFILAAWQSVHGLQSRPAWLSQNKLELQLEPCIEVKNCRPPADDRTPVSDVLVGEGPAACRARHSRSRARGTSSRQRLLGRGRRGQCGTGDGDGATVAEGWASA